MPKLKLASRNASRKLATILLVLLVPVASLLYLFADRSLGEIRAIQLQIVGATYLNQIQPAFDALVKSKDPTSDLKAMLLPIPAALSNQRPELEMDVQSLLEASADVSADAGSVVWQFRSIIQDTSLASDLVFAKARDTQLLADSATKTLPDYALLVRRAAVSGERLSESEFTAARNEAFSDLSEAIKSDETHGLASLLNEKLAKQYLASDKLLNSLQDADAALYSAAASELLNNISDLQTAATLALKGKLQGAASTLKWNLACSLGLVGLAMLVALGFAVHMMAKTFLQLDLVEASERASQKAEAEARTFAEDMQRLNTEIAGLNRELSANYKLLETTQAENIQKSKMAQLGALTAMVAHELRNPLGAIRNTAFLINAMSQKMQADFSKQIGRIEQAVKRCDGIIGQLLDYAASRDIKPVSFPVYEWLEKSVQHQAAELPAWLTITLEDHTEDAIVTGDPSKLEQCLHNIFKNSVQALEPIVASHSNMKAEILIRANLANDRLVLSISDNGPGIPEDKLGIVTEPMFTTKSFGPGLGLAFVDQVVKLHSGDLDIQSIIGRGTTVSISLPQSIGAAQVA